MSQGHYIPEDGPVSLDDICPVDHVVRCDKCGRLQFIADYQVDSECGPDFSRDTFCDGKVRITADHDPLLAAYKLGGELAAYVLLFDGCKACIAVHLYGSVMRCPEHQM